MTPEQYQAAVDCLVDEIMENKRKDCSLHGTLEGELILGDELALIWNAPWKYQQVLLDDLRAKSRRVVERFVMSYMDQEIIDCAQGLAEDANPKNEYSPDRRYA